MKAFTLIELSIVLVIIGLIAGGVLVGRDLIAAAAVRAQITQIEKYHQAVNTFKLKYNYLPGDIPDPTASQFGFVVRGTYPAGGDGNGLLQAYCCGYTFGQRQGNENTAFWVDLTTVKLIPESFNTATPVQSGTNPITNFDLYWPKAKIGSANYVYSWSGGPYTLGSTDGSNYFGISILTSVDTSGAAASSKGLTVKQAQSMDIKLDDGRPQSGNVQANYAAGVNYWGGDWTDAAPGSAVSASSTSCYDNSGNSANPMQYSVSQNNGNGMNCALSFKFQ